MTPYKMASYTSNINKRMANCVLKKPKFHNCESEILQIQMIIMENSFNISKILQFK